MSIKYLSKQSKMLPPLLKDESLNSKQQILIDRFADLMIERLFQDIDKDKKLYTKK